MSTITCDPLHVHDYMFIITCNLLHVHESACGACYAHVITSNVCACTVMLCECRLLSGVGVYSHG